MSLDEQHAAYDRQQQRPNIANIGLDDHHAAHNRQRASSSEIAYVVPQRGRETYTEVCGNFSPSLHDPPLQPNGKTLQGNLQYHCPRCDTTYSRSHTVKQHFPRCIKTNGNPNSLRWFDHESNNLTGTRNPTNLKATITPSKRKRSGYSIASLLADEPEAIMATAKVDKWAAMAAEKQAATIASTSNNPTGSGHLATHILSAVTASIVDKSSHGTAPVADKPAATPTPTPKQARPLVSSAARDESVTPEGKQQQLISRKPKTPRRPSHVRDQAHLFNNAGVLMPSIPGIDSVTERLFDQGEIMSLGPSRSHENYYPDGEPHGGSFILDYSSQKKRKRDDES